MNAVTIRDGIDTVRLNNKLLVQRNAKNIELLFQYGGPAKLAPFEIQKSKNYSLDAWMYKDISRALTQHIDEEDKTIQVAPYGQNTKTVGKLTFINESGLYYLAYYHQHRK